MSDLTVTFLGTGTSVGIPMIGCDCETCQSVDPRDNRTRSSILITTPESTFVVDTGPDFRNQCLREKIRHLDAALYTHPHMDHVTGFDELRRFCVAEDAIMPIYAQPSCLEVLQRMYVHAFNGENRYRGYLKPESRAVTGPFWIGETEITPLPVKHGKVEAIGYLFSRHGKRHCAYLSDMKEPLPGTIEQIQGVDTLIVDALRHTPHPTHMSFTEALEFRALVKPRHTWFTHLQCEILHAKEEPLLPSDVKIAYDGLQLHWND
jgi:phosphoribosyl 1,2-cyclic phosphate phosphodiesterase